MNKIRTLAEVMGFVSLGLLALYGLLALCGVAGPLGLAIEAGADAPAVPQEAAVLAGTIPLTMNYQGFLRDPDGDLTTGVYDITARIYTAAEGGTLLYETTVPNVTVRDGLFNIVLGEDPALPTEAFSDPPRFISIELNDNGQLTPRQHLHAVPWAMTASTLVADAHVQGLSSSGDLTLADGSDFIIEGGDIDATGNLNMTGNIDATGNLNVTGDVDVGGGLSVDEGLSVNGGLSVDPPLVLIRRYKDVGNDADFDTDISGEVYECVATGWEAYFDFQESGTYNNLVWTYLPDWDDTWHAAIIFASHINNESPDVDILCFRKEITLWDGQPRSLFTPGVEP